MECTEDTAARPRYQGIAFNWEHKGVAGKGIDALAPVHDARAIRPANMMRS